MIRTTPTNRRDCRGHPAPPPPTSHRPLPSPCCGPRMNETLRNRESPRLDGNAPARLIVWEQDGSWARHLRRLLTPDALESTKPVPPPLAARWWARARPPSWLPFGRVPLLMTWSTWPVVSAETIPPLESFAVADCIAAPCVGRSLKPGSCGFALRLANLVQWSSSYEVIWPGCPNHPGRLSSVFGMNYPGIVAKPGSEMVAW